jgi:hypothetical protein
MNHNSNQPARPNIYMTMAILAESLDEKTQDAAMKNINLFQKFEYQRQVDADYEAGLCDRQGNYYQEGR